MLNYRTSEIRGDAFNSVHSRTALCCMGAEGDQAVDCQTTMASMQRLPGSACLRQAVLLMCPAAAASPQCHHLSLPTCRHHRLPRLSIIARYATPIGRRRGSEGRVRAHQWAVINRRPGACLLVAAGFLGGAARGATGALILTGFLGISNESVATTRTEPASERVHARQTVTVVNRTPETSTTVHCSPARVVPSKPSRN